MSGEIIKADKVLTIGQRVEFYLENDDTRYTSRIEDMTQDLLIVAMWMQQNPSVTATTAVLSTA